MYTRLCAPVRLRSGEENYGLGQTFPHSDTKRAEHLPRPFECSVSVVYSQLASASGVTFSPGIINSSTCSARSTNLNSISERT